MTRRGHVHTCHCGNELHCGFDNCAADCKPWICHACQMLAMDDYINDLQARMLTESTRSTTQPVTPKEN